jgi:hypothetical protein
MKTVGELGALLRQHTWDKDVVLWVGRDAVLVETLGQTRWLILDLLDLFDENNLPMHDDETQIHLASALRARLKAMPTGPADRSVLLVKSIGLLARYNVGTREFYEWFCGDFSMVVLVIDCLMENPVWPEEVICDTDRLLGYFEEPHVVKSVFGAKG